MARGTERCDRKTFLGDNVLLIDARTERAPHITTIVFGYSTFCWNWMEPVQFDRLSHSIACLVLQHSSTTTRTHCVMPKKQRHAAGLLCINRDTPDKRTENPPASQLPMAFVRAAEAIASKSKPIEISCC